MKRSVCLIALLLVAALCLATSSVFAADISPHAPDFDDPQRQAEVDAVTKVILVITSLYELIQFRSRALRLLRHASTMTRITIQSTTELIHVQCLKCYLQLTQMQAISSARLNLIPSRIIGVKS